MNDCDGEPRVTFLPVAGVPQLGINPETGYPRVGPGLHFVPDGKGGGRLYVNAEPGARMVARVRRYP